MYSELDAQGKAATFHTLPTNPIPKEKEPDDPLSSTGTAHGRRINIRRSAQQAGNCFRSDSREFAGPSRMSKQFVKQHREVTPYRRQTQRPEGFSHTRGAESSLADAVHKMGVVRESFTDWQKDRFDEARQECEALQRQLMSMRNEDALKAFKVMETYALVAGKGFDYESALNLSDWVINDYLPSCEDQDLRQAAERVVGMAFDRIGRPLFSLYRGHEKNPVIEQAQDRMIRLCQNCQFQCLKWMSENDGDRLFYSITRVTKANKQLDQLSGILTAITYNELALRSITERRHPPSPWRARLYWLVIAMYNNSMSLSAIKYELDKIEKEITPVQSERDIAKAYLDVRVELIAAYEQSDDKDALEKVDQMLTDIDEDEFAFDTLRKRAAKRAEVLKSKAMMLIDRNRLKEAGELINQVEEIEKAHDIHSSLKTRVLKTKFLRVSIGKHPRDQKDRDDIKREIQSLLPEKDKFEGVKLELACCYEFLGDLSAAEAILASYAGRHNVKTKNRRAILLEGLGRYSEACELLEPLLKVDDNLHKTQLNYAICLKNRVSAGGDASQESQELEEGEITDGLSGDKKKEYLSEALKLLKKAINNGPEDWRSGWGALGHLCDDLKNNHVLEFRKYKRFLPDALQSTTGWKDAASKATTISKAVNPAEAADIQQGLKATVQPESYRASKERRERRPKPY